MHFSLISLVGIPLKLSEVYIHSLIEAKSLLLARKLYVFFQLLSQRNALIFFISIDIRAASGAVRSLIIRKGQSLLYGCVSELVENGLVLRKVQITFQECKCSRIVFSC